MYPGMMLLNDWSLYVSKFVKFLLDCKTISPPYCGFPNASHQLPVPAVVGLVVLTGVVDTAGVEEVTEVVGLGVEVVG
jgi:hypothetical protein